MEPNRETPRLCSLSDWSFRHIRNIFEAQSDEQALREIAATFSDAVDASLNGTPLTREGINRLVLTMRQASPRGLRVHWQQAVEVPQDSSTNRDGSFGGVYIIRGIHKLLPGTTKPVEFERHKTVTVKIESQSTSPAIDSRRIVNLVFVASDVRVDRQAAM